jgi:aspartate-semialdehyde dehydrogenase
MLENYRGVPQELKLPTAPERPIVVMREDNRPQPRLDRYLGDGRSAGMTVCVGRFGEDNIFDYRFVVLSHNTIRGAAGAAILNAELLEAQGYMR